MKKIFFDELDSTNNYLKEKHSQYENFDCVIAKQQTHGRGRKNRIWQMNVEDLAFSILFKEEHNHSLIAPLSIIYALKELNIDAKIKWPNDIYIDSLKVCGILQEKIYNDIKCEATIIGIGINFTPHNEFSSTYLNKYCSVSNYDFLDIILKKYNDLLLISENDLLVLYKLYSLVLGKDINYNNKKYKIIDFNLNAEIIAVDDHNKLVINANELDIKNALIKS